MLGCCHTGAVLQLNLAGARRQAPGTMACHGMATHRVEAHVLTSVQSDQPFGELTDLKVAGPLQRAAGVSAPPGTWPCSALRSPPGQMRQSHGFQWSCSLHQFARGRLHARKSAAAIAARRLQVPTGGTGPCPSSLATARVVAAGVYITTPSRTAAGCARTG